MQARYQNGCLTTITRKDGIERWQFRWRSRNPNGSLRPCKKTIGPTDAGHSGTPGICVMVRSSASFRFDPRRYRTARAVTWLRENFRKTNTGSTPMCRLRTLRVRSRSSSRRAKYCISGFRKRAPTAYAKLTRFSHRRSSDGVFAYEAGSGKERIARHL